MEEESIREMEEANQSREQPVEQTDRIVDITEVNEQTGEVSASELMDSMVGGFKKQEIN